MLSSINRWIVTAAESVVLIPLWRMVIPPRNGRVAAAMGTAAVWFVALAVVAGMGDEDGRSNAIDRLTSAEISASPTPIGTARPMRSPRTSPTPSMPAGQAAQLTPNSEPSPSTPTPTTGPVTDESSPPPSAAPVEALTVVSSTSYTDDIGTLHVAGEVRNNGAEYMEFVEITGTFFNASEQVVASDYTYTHADFVGPGETAGFDLPLIDGGSLGISRYELALAGEVTADRPAPGLVIQGESANVDGAGDYHVLGTVVNQSGAVAEFVKVVGTFYGADGTVVRSDFAYTELEVVPPGGTDTFDLSLPDGGSAGIARYSLVVEGFPG